MALMEKTVAMDVTVKTALMAAMDVTAKTVSMARTVSSKRFSEEG